MTTTQLTPKGGLPSNITITGHAGVIMGGKQIELVKCVMDGTERLLQVVDGKWSTLTCNIDGSFAKFVATAPGVVQWI